MSAVAYSPHLAQRVISALLADNERPDWESAIELVISEWGPDTTRTRDDAVDVVEHIAASVGVRS